MDDFGSIVNIIPTNPIQALAEGKVLPTIFFAIMIGVGILLAGPAGEPLKRFFDSAAEVVMKVTMLVMELAPLGVMALMAWVLATKGFAVVVNMGKLALALYLCCFLQIAIVYWGLIVKGILRLPLMPFIRALPMRKALLSRPVPQVRLYRRRFLAPRKTSVSTNQLLARCCRWERRSIWMEQRSIWG